MKEKKLEAYLIPSEDQHMSEYVPECYQRRKWITGFTGSAGMGSFQFACVPSSCRYAHRRPSLDRLEIFPPSREGTSILLAIDEIGNSRVFKSDGTPNLIILHPGMAGSLSP